MDANFFPESAFQLRKRYGRRWAVFQSFALGGSTDEILRRAQVFCDQRCREFGKPCPATVDVDRSFLRDYSSFYPARLRKLGWTVTLWGDRWTVRMPQRASHVRAGLCTRPGRHCVFGPI